jgi:hypothetical protein
VSAAFVKAMISPEQGGPYAGKEVEVLADDYAAKGDEEMIEVKVGDDLIYVEKKFVNPGDEAMQKAETRVTSETSEDEEISFDAEDDDDSEDDDEEFSYDLEDLEDSEDGEDDKEDEDDEEEILSFDSEDDEDDSEDDEEEFSYDVDSDDETSDDDDIQMDVMVEPEPVAQPTKVDIMRSRLKKSMQELEDIRSQMKSTFTSTDTISSTITSLRGMLDALQKDAGNERTN